MDRRRLVRVQDQLKMQAPGPRVLVPGPRVPGSWSLAPESRFLALVPGPSSWFLVSGSWSMVPGPWVQVPGPGPWFLAPGPAALRSFAGSRWSSGVDGGSGGRQEAEKVAHQQRPSSGLYGQQDASQRAEDAGQSEGAERLDHRPRHQHLKEA